MLKVGMVGCGDIASIYALNAPAFRNLEVVAVGARRFDAAAAFAAEHSLKALSIDEIMASEEIDLILNLTAPAAHSEISLRAIEAGKHVFTEKPLATSLSDGRRIIESASAKGVRVGVAPDTVLGPAVQRARYLVDEGAIGRPIAGLSVMMNRGMEQRHPKPDFFFKPGGGPVMDIGPYYFSAMVMLLGSIRSVTATGMAGFAERFIGSPGNPRLGEAICVEVMTTVQGVLTFEVGAQISFSFSWDVHRHGAAPIELYGSEASIRLPDPNFFGGTIELSHGRDDWRVVDVADEPFGRANFPRSGPIVANYRGLGLAEMANAITEARPHRVCGNFGFHILETLLAINEAAREQRAVEIRSRVARPALLAGDDAGRLFRHHSKSRL